MASDQLVTARLLLQCQMELQRRGRKQLLRHLEQVEPELASYLMESSSTLHQQLFQLGGPPKATQRVHHAMMDLLLVCLLSLRTGQSQLWP